MSTNYQMTSYFGNDVICYCDVSFIHSTFHSSNIHRPFSTWRFWVYCEVKQTVIKFWIC